MNRATFPVIVLTMFLAMTGAILGQNQSPTIADPLHVHIAAFTLHNQSVADGIAMLNETTSVPFSFEFPLATTISADAPQLKSLNHELSSGTIAEILDQLCSLDSTFEWVRIGDSVNVFPRAYEKDPTYLLNRKLKVLSFKDVPDVQRAVFEILAQLDEPKEQIAVLGPGGILALPKSFTATYSDITVREAFDKVAQLLGPSFGWQFGGAADFRIIQFHARMAVRPKTPARFPKQ